MAHRFIGVGLTSRDANESLLLWRVSLETGLFTSQHLKAFFHANHCICTVYRGVAGLEPSRYFPIIWGPTVTPRRAYVFARRGRPAGLARQPACRLARRMGVRHLGSRLRRLKNSDVGMSSIFWQRKNTTCYFRLRIRIRCWIIWTMCSHCVPAYYLKTQIFQYLMFRSTW